MKQIETRALAPARSRAASTSRAAAAAAIALCGVTLGCSTDEPDPGTQGVLHEEIIGGFPATGAQLNAIGAIARVVNGQLVPFTTGTLISPTMVLATKHNLRSITDVAQVKFLIGPDAFAPLRAVPVRGFAVEPTVSGGLTDNGSDVGILHLAEPIVDVPLLAVAALTDDRIGSRMVGVGYGAQNSAGVRGTRRAGSMTVQATSGSALAAAFGTFDTFLARGGDALPPGVDPRDPANRPFLQQVYDTELLLPGIEAWIGGGPEDAMACQGDGGAPVIAQVGARTTVFGVSSWRYAPSDLACQPIGAAYATMNPIALDFVDYEAHCPLVPRAGTCESPVIAVRCARGDEGGRRVLRTDCGQLGQVCGFDAAGALGCVDPR